MEKANKFFTRKILTEFIAGMVALVAVVSIVNFCIEQRHIGDDGIDDREFTIGQEFVIWENNLRNPFDTSSRDTIIITGLSEKYVQYKVSRYNNFMDSVTESGKFHSRSRYGFLSSITRIR